MATSYADFEFGLVWDDKQQSFDISLRFTGRLGGAIEDFNLHPKGAVPIDLAELGQLARDESAYGERLSACVFEQEEVRRFFARVLTAAQDVPLHFRLHLDGPARFHSVRWELLRDPHTGTPIATSNNVLFSRYLMSGEWGHVPDAPDSELQALVVIAAPTDLDGYRAPGRAQLARVDVEDELRRARDALAPFHPVVLAGGGAATLANTLAQLNKGVDILYVVGHGVQTPDVPLLFLEKADGTADPVDARRLEERIRDLAHRPTLVVLSSCQSAGTGDQRHSEDGGALAAVGPRLAAAGVAAVVAMQGDLTMATASRFVPVFFEALAQDLVVDRAMALARNAVRDRDDWWVPVLFSRLRSGRVRSELGFTERSEATWQILDTMIETGRFTPVLGPGLADGILGSRESMARRWARRWQMPMAAHAVGNFAQVAQYLRVSHNPAMVPGELLKYLRTALHERITNARRGDPFFELPQEIVDDGDFEDTILEVGRRMRASSEDDPFRVVASLPARIFVTTGITNLLEAAMAQAQPAKQPLTVCFPWTGRVSWDDLGTDPAAIDPPTVAKPWVYHLFGRLKEPRSLVLTEDDYFDWLDAWIVKKDITQIVPPAVKAALTGTSLLFLGYRLEDWDFRVVFQSIRSFNLPGRYDDHIGVQLRPQSRVIERDAAQRYLEAYFGEARVNIFWSDTRTFLHQLRRRTGLP